jgi:hypothetical protein
VIISKGKNVPIRLNQCLGNGNCTTALALCAAMDVALFILIKEIIMSLIPVYDS